MLAPKRKSTINAKADADSSKGSHGRSSRVSANRSKKLINKFVPEKRQHLATSLLKKILVNKLGTTKITESQWIKLFAEDGEMMKIGKRYNETHFHKAINGLNALSLLREDVNDLKFVYEWILVNLYDVEKNDFVWDNDQIKQNLKQLYMNEATYVPHFAPELKEFIVLGFNEHLDIHTISSKKDLFDMITTATVEILKRYVNDTGFDKFKKDHEYENYMLHDMMHSYSKYEEYDRIWKIVFKDLIELKLIEHISSDVLLVTYNELDAKLNLMYDNGDLSWLIIFERYWIEHKKQPNLVSLRTEPLDDDNDRVYLHDFLTNVFRNAKKELNKFGWGVLNKDYPCLSLYKDILLKEDLPLLTEQFFDQIEKDGLLLHIQALAKDIYRLKKTCQYHNICYDAYENRIDQDVLQVSPHGYLVSVLTVVCNRHVNNNGNLIKTFVDCFGGDLSIQFNFPILWDIYKDEYIERNGVFTGFLPDLLLNELYDLWITEARSEQYNTMVFQCTSQVLVELDEMLIVNYDGLQEAATMNDLRFCTRFWDYFQDEYLVAAITGSGGLPYMKRKKVDKVTYRNAQTISGNNWVMDENDFPYYPMRNVLLEYMANIQVNPNTFIESYFPCLSKLVNVDNANRLIRWYIRYFLEMFDRHREVNQIGRVNLFVEIMLFPLVSAMVRCAFEEYMKRPSYRRKTEKEIDTTGLSDKPEGPLIYDVNTLEITLVIPPSKKIRDITVECGVRFNQNLTNEFQGNTMDMNELKANVEEIASKQLNIQATWKHIKSVMPKRALTPFEIEQGKGHLMTNGSAYLNIKEFTEDELRKGVRLHMIHVYDYLKKIHRQQQGVTGGILRVDYDQEDERETLFTRPIDKGQKQFEDLVNKIELLPEDAEEIPLLQRTIQTIQNDVVLPPQIWSALRCLNLADENLIDLVVECLFGDPYYYENDKKEHGPALSPVMKHFISEPFYNRIPRPPYINTDEEYRLIVTGCYWFLEAHRIHFFAGNLPVINHAEWAIAYRSYKRNKESGMMRTAILNNVVFDNGLINELNFTDPDVLLKSWIDALSNRMRRLVWATRIKTTIPFSVYLNTVESNVDTRHVAFFNEIYTKHKKPRDCIIIYEQLYFLGPTRQDDPTPLTLEWPLYFDDRDKSDATKLLNDLNGTRFQRMALDLVPPKVKPPTKVEPAPVVPTPVKPDVTGSSVPVTSRKRLVEHEEDMGAHPDEEDDSPKPIEKKTIPSVKSDSSKGIKKESSSEEEEEDDDEEEEDSSSEEEEEDTMEVKEKKPTRSSKKAIKTPEKKTDMEVEPAKKVDPIEEKPPPCDMIDTLELVELRKAIKFYIQRTIPGKDDQLANRLRDFGERSVMRGELQHVFVSLLDEYVQSMNTLTHMTVPEVRTYFTTAVESYQEMIKNNVYHEAWNNMLNMPVSKPTIKAYVEMLFNIAEVNFRDMKVFKEKVISEDYLNFLAFKDSKNNMVNLQLTEFTKTMNDTKTEIKNLASSIIADNKKELNTIMDTQAGKTQDFYLKQDEKLNKLYEKGNNTSEKIGGLVADLKTTMEAKKADLNTIAANTKELTDKIGTLATQITASQATYKTESEGFLKKIGAFYTKSEQVHNHLLQQINGLLGDVIQARGKRRIGGVSGHIKPTGHKSGTNILPAIVKEHNRQFLCGSCGDLSGEIKKRLDQGERFTLVVCDYHAKQLIEDGVEQPTVLLKEKNDSFYYYLY